MIEVELRSFISKEKYDELIAKYNVEAQKQITYYFDTKQDFRMMKTKDYTQLWLKTGKMHEESRLERVVKVDNKYRNDLESMLELLEYNVDIKWFRTRTKINLEDNAEMCIDYTIGYGYILEIEKQVSEDVKVEDAKKLLEKDFSTLGISVSKKEDFDSKYNDYVKNWKEYTKDVNEEEFLK